MGNSSGTTLRNTYLYFNRIILSFLKFVAFRVNLSGKPITKGPLREVGRLEIVLDWSHFLSACAVVALCPEKHVPVSIARFRQAVQYYVSTLSPFLLASRVRKALVVSPRESR